MSTAATVLDTLALLWGRLGRTAPWRTLTRSWPLVVAVGCMAWVAANRSTPVLDMQLFALAGGRLWSRAGLDVFDDSFIQAGVAQLTLYHWTVGLDRALGTPHFEATSVVLHLAITLGFAALATLPHRLLLRPVPRSLPLLAGSAALLLGFGSDLYLSGHPAEFFVPALWLGSAFLAARGRPVPAGLLLAASTTFETWGALGAPVLLLLPTWSARVRAGVVCAVGLLVAWGPFIVLGEFRMHELDWLVRSNSVLAPLLGVNAPFGWELRLLQGGSALGLGLLAAAKLRRPSTALWAVPLVVVCARLAVDPVAAGYYWTPAQMFGILALADVAARRDLRGLVLAIPLYPIYLLNLVPQWGMALSGLLAVLLAVVLDARVAASSVPRAEDYRGRALDSRVRARVPTL